MTRELSRQLRTRIRDFEDRKITAAELSREIFFAAREVSAPSEANLRQRLEILGNRVSSLVEESLTDHVHPKILKVVDDIESELVRWGY